MDARDDCAHLRARGRIKDLHSAVAIRNPGKPKLGAAQALGARGYDGRVGASQLVKVGAAIRFAANGSDKRTLANLPDGWSSRPDDRGSIGQRVIDKDGVLRAVRNVIPAVGRIYEAEVEHGERLSAGPCGPRHRHDVNDRDRVILRGTAELTTFNIPTRAREQCARQ